MKKILLLATGGTIASKRTAEGLTPLITSQELTEYVPRAARFCQLDTLELFQLDSTNIQPHHWLQITDAIEKNYQSYDGFVVCHGTDTMAYSGAALSYLIQNSRKPIVITGSQRPIDMEDTDARRNLLDSLFFAADDRAQGVVIVFDGKVIAGTRARKTKSKSYNAFSSINFPYLAVIQDERVVFYIPPEPVFGEPVFYQNICDKVCVLKLFPGIQADVPEFLGQSYEAIILESFGVGGIPVGPDKQFIKAIEKLLTAGKIIVMATQVIHEGSDMSIYKVGNLFKKQYPLLESFDMTLEATITKMMWILGMTNNIQNVHSLFYKSIFHDIILHK